MRKNCLSTPPAWAFSDPEHADNTVSNGWDVEGSAGPKTASIPAGAARVSVELCGISESRSDEPRDIAHAPHAEKRRSSSVAYSIPTAVMIFSTANLRADAVRPR